MLKLTFSALLIAMLVGCTPYPPEETKATKVSDGSLPAPGEFVPMELMPELIRKVDPEYPRLAQQAQIEGTVIVMALVDKTGNVIDVKIAKTSGTASLDEAAMQAAKQYKYKPGIQNGQPVACWVTHAVEFKLP